MHNPEARRNGATAFRHNPHRIRESGDFLRHAAFTQYITCLVESNVDDGSKLHKQKMVQELSAEFKEIGFFAEGPKGEPPVTN